MNLITLENINKSYSEKILLRDISLGINEGDKIGIIGINGSGKSSLLEIISGKDEFFDGKVVKGKNIRIEYLSQNSKFNEKSSVIEQIFRGETEEMKILMEYEETLESLNKDSSNKEMNKRLLDLQNKIDSLNLWGLESEAKSILNKLGITDYNAIMKTLSGGQRKRVSLASALISPCDLLILDEPTNHLDLEAIEWLESHLNGRKGALIMITHDRYFLDRVVNRTLELDRGSLYLYEGNYTEFLEKKSERLEREESTENKRQSLIKKELKWVKRGAKARTTKQKARLERFEELVNTEYLKVDTDVQINFIGRRLGKKIIEINDINKVYNNKKIISGFSYIFNKEDRIGIVGPNGVGKTTLINILKGSVAKDSGSIDIGETVKIGCFSQDDSHMDTNMKAIDYVREGGEVIPVEDGSTITASTLCERFLFTGTMQYTKIEKLSGGERRRLHLLRILMEAPNVLLLDEPTNDLDINTLNILEDFLDSFIGVVAVVSHDRYFLDRICNKIFSYKDNGYIDINNGNYSDYITRKEFEKSDQVKEDKKDNKKSFRVKEKEQKPKLSFKEGREYEEVESLIKKLEEKISNIEHEMIKNSSSYSKLEELSNEKEKLEEELLFRYERYEYLEELVKKIEDYKKESK